MGSGSWTRKAFSDYSTTKGMRTLSDGSLDIKSRSAQEIYKARKLDKALNPLNVIRECRDSKEHPNTIPVILALDVTGSMGQAAVEVAAELNNIMTELYSSIKDVEFMIMGIGDFAYDVAPLQVSQFESDIRIAEQLDKIYFEFGGGGNSYESYTAAWKFAITQTDLDCWSRGKKGIIITMGDENINPYIDANSYREITGVSVQGNIETVDLYEQVIEKFDVYHINVKHGQSDWVNHKAWKNTIGTDHYYSCEVKAVPQVIAQIVRDHETADYITGGDISNNTNAISW